MSSLTCEILHCSLTPLTSQFPATLAPQGVAGGCASAGCAGDIFSRVQSENATNATSQLSSQITVSLSRIVHNPDGRLDTVLSAFSLTPHCNITQTNTGCRLTVYSHRFAKSHPSSSSSHPHPRPLSLWLLLAFRILTLAIDLTPDYGPSHRVTTSSESQ